MQYQLNEEQTSTFINPIFCQESETPKYLGFYITTPQSKDYRRFFLRKGVFFDENGKTSVRFYWELSFDGKTIDKHIWNHTQVLEMCAYILNKYSNEFTYWENGVIKKYTISKEAIDFGLYLTITKNLPHNVFPEKCSLNYLVAKLEL